MVSWCGELFDMVICPKCETLIRNGEHVRVYVIGLFNRRDGDTEGHWIEPYDEEYIEHLHCCAEAWEERFIKWTRRKWRCFRSTLLGR